MFNKKLEIWRVFNSQYYFRGQRTIVIFIKNILAGKTNRRIIITTQNM